MELAIQLEKLAQFGNCFVDVLLSTWKLLTHKRFVAWDILKGRLIDRNDARYYSQSKRRFRIAMGKHSCVEILKSQEICSINQFQMYRKFARDGWGVNALIGNMREALGETSPFGFIKA
ncbi:hypothetical protein HNY73_015373 [Argiope bruennichi]|uniref:Uncharacterized protein n=1 Tax=Argiope bruennichi TaxID=94029 RepID=A0A8T0ERV6_ARGBR|nr:hypothetical protein HNY73_015373 [Argiope bruennichi]